RAVVAVDDPAVTRAGRKHARAEHVDRRLPPAGLVIEGVELDVGNAEDLRQPLRRGRLAARRAAHHGDALHGRWNSPRATATAEPPTSTSSSECATAKSVDGRPISPPCLISISSPNAIRPCRARWSASGPAAEPVAGSSSTPCAGTKTRTFHVAPSRAKHIVPNG